MLGSHSCISTASGCPSLKAGSGFAFTTLRTFFAHPGHIVVGTVAVSDSWARLELALLCTFDVLWTRLEPSSQLLCTPGLGATRQLELDQLLCTLSPMLASCTVSCFRTVSATLDTDFSFVVLIIWTSRARDQHCRRQLVRRNSSCCNHTYSSLDLSS